MTTLELIHAYSGGSAGLAFRFRQESPYDALARRLAITTRTSRSGGWHRRNGSRARVVGGPLAPA